MSLIAAVNAFIAAESVPNDGVGSTSLHPILPPTGEMIIGSLASIIVFSALFKFAGPTIKKSFSDRTARIQKELDDSAAAAAAAEAEAVRIRSAKGDIDAERMKVHIRLGKGKKDRFVTLPKQALITLRQYWSTHRHPSLLFPAGKTAEERLSAIKIMDRGGLQKSFKAIREDCGISKPATPHTLRH